MRISDWSSDVCSSDLPRRGLRVYKPTLHEFHEIVKLRCCLEGYATKEAVAVMDQKTVNKIKVSIRKFDRLGHKKEMDMAAVIEEIGRAACRERVCQYV